MEVAMARVKIRDDAIWLKHVEGDPALRQRIENLVAGDVIELEADGIVGRWQRMNDGKDGRPTLGIRPIDSMREVWARLRRDTGRIIEVREVVTADSYLRALTPMLSEWDSPEDEAAFRDL
jgi:hypothetical protein